MCPYREFERVCGDDIFRNMAVVKKKRKLHVLALPIVATPQPLKSQTVRPRDMGKSATVNDLLLAVSLKTARPLVSSPDSPTVIVSDTT